MHDGINRADILSCFLYMRVYSTEPPEGAERLHFLFKIKVFRSFYFALGGN